MKTAADANEYRHSLGPDFTTEDAYGPGYVDPEEVEDVDLMSVEQRQALNAKMAEWFGS